MCEDRRGGPRATAFASRSEASPENPHPVQLGSKKSGRGRITFTFRRAALPMAGGPQHAPRSVSASRRRAANRRVDLRHGFRSEEHTSELQSQSNLVCRLLLEKKKNIN